MYTAKSGGHNRHRRLELNSIRSLSEVRLNEMEGMVKSTKESAAEVFEDLADVRIVKIPGVSIQKTTLGRFGLRKMPAN
jgi:hypothetical protein